MRCFTHEEKNHTQTYTCPCCLCITNEKDWFSSSTKDNHSKQRMVSSMGETLKPNGLKKKPEWNKTRTRWTFSVRRWGNAWAGPPPAGWRRGRAGGPPRRWRRRWGPQRARPPPPRHGAPPWPIPFLHTHQRLSWAPGVLERPGRGWDPQVSPQIQGIWYSENIWNS